MNKYQEHLKLLYCGMLPKISEELDLLVNKKDVSPLTSFLLNLKDLFINSDNEEKLILLQSLQDIKHGLNTKYNLSYFIDCEIQKFINSLEFSNELIQSWEENLDVYIKDKELEKEFSILTILKNKKIENEILLPQEKKLENGNKAIIISKEYLNYRDIFHINSNIFRLLAITSEEYNNQNESIAMYLRNSSKKELSINNSNIFFILEKENSEVICVNIPSDIKAKEIASILVDIALTDNGFNNKNEIDLVFQEKISMLIKQKRANKINENLEQKTEYRKGLKI